MLALLTHLFSPDAAALPPAPCRFGDAVYQDEANAAYTLHVHEKRGALGLDLESGATGKTYAFRPVSGAGYSTTVLEPERASARLAHTITIYAITESRTVSAEFPGAGAPAPAYLFAPELGRMLWYEAEQLGGPPLASGLRESLPRTFFRLVDCRRD